MNALLWLVCYASTSKAAWALWRSLPSSIRLACYDRLFRKSSLPKASLSVAQLPCGLALKKTDRSPHPEAENMTFVAEHTSIPVPRLFDVVEGQKTTGCGYILMGWIQGEPLNEWITSRGQRTPEQTTTLAELTAALGGNDIEALDQAIAKMQSLPPPTLDLSDCAGLIDDLQRSLTELRALPPPSGAVTGLGGRPLTTVRCGDPEEIGPFSSQDEFKDFLLGLASTNVEHRFPELRRLAAPVRARKHRICFTHADLHGANILVKDNRLAAIIDWEHAGWYPEYWELTMTERHQMTVPLLQQFWDVVRPDWVARYQEELILECALWKCTGDTIIADDSGDDFACERVVRRLKQDT